MSTTYIDRHFQLLSAKNLFCFNNRKIRQAFNSFLKVVSVIVYDPKVLFYFILSWHKEAVHSC